LHALVAAIHPGEFPGVSGLRSIEQVAQPAATLDLGVG
jgi:hypothetical protein